MFEFWDLEAGDYMQVELLFVLLVKNHFLMRTKFVHITLRKKHHLDK